MKIKNRFFGMLFAIVVLCPLLFAAEYAELVGRGLIFLNQGRTEEAIVVLQQARDIQPSSPEIYYYLGNAYYSDGAKEQARENYEKAVNLNPENPDYQYSLALVYLAEGKHQEAVQRLDRVMEIAPASRAGRAAKNLKSDVISGIADRERQQRWSETAEEARPEAPRRIEDTPEEREPVRERERQTAEQLIRRIRFGTDTSRRAASTNLADYPKEELLKVMEDIDKLIFLSEEPEIRANLLTALGKIGTSESNSILLGIINDTEEPFEMRREALENLAVTREIAEPMENILLNMLDEREKQREKAKENIGAIEADIDRAEARSLGIERVISEKQERFRALSREISDAEIPPEYIDHEGPPPASVQNIARLRAERRNIEGEIAEKNQERTAINEELSELRARKERYETLLSQERPQTAEESEDGLLAMRVIDVLGKTRYKEGLPVVQRAWEEFGSDDRSIFYFLALARLGDFSELDALESRLRTNYPGGQALYAEIDLRVGIIEVIGDYLSQRQDAWLYGLIEFLSEEGSYPQIKGAASGVISSISETPSG